MNLKESLEKKRFVVTSEIQVPMGDEEPEHLVESLGRVKGRVDGVSIQEMELEGVVSDTIKSCSLLKANNFNAIYQTTTRDKNRYQLQKDLTQAHETGVDNLLVFTEDYRITGDSLQETMFFHVDSGKLGSVLDHLKKGMTIEGKELEARAEFLLGSGVETPWGKNMPKKGMEEMEDMINVGTGYFLTTPIFDVEQFAKFMKQVDPFKVPVIAEVMILRTAGMGKFLNRHFKSGLVPEWVIQKLAQAPDKKKASMDLFADTIKNLRDVCQGVHIITMGSADHLVDYLNAAKLR
ncbi:methylenetetrahydrofolate reductase [Desulfospira joergensenii]|uniref:methylenetetrahydrofolate reductase n=1 Tax=Desulfospira joergensenii TaxID=53329 RepID=UPI0003B7339D|nr:methylenetetrahydrofolate reductase [Desulfospira joergensenii]